MVRVSRHDAGSTLSCALQACKRTDGPWKNADHLLEITRRKGLIDYKEQLQRSNPGQARKQN